MLNENYEHLTQCPQCGATFLSSEPRPSCNECGKSFCSKDCRAVFHKDLAHEYRRE